jgi:hypothetical protein
MYEIEKLDNQRGTGISTIPQSPHTTYIVASKGMGKSTLLLNLLTKVEFYKGKYNKIYWISPTAELDKKLDILRNTDIMTPNVKLIALLKKLAKKDHQEIMSKSKQEFLNYNVEDYETKMDDSNFITEFSFDWLKGICDENKYITKNFGKEYSDKILLVFDDSIGDKIWNKSPMIKMILNSRHLNISAFIVSQSYFCLPKTIRNNNSMLILFESSNRKELDSIYNENSCGLSFKEFYGLYRESTDEQFGFMCINYQSPKQYRLQNKFKEIFDLS